MVGVEILVPASGGEGSSTEHAKLGVDEDVGGVYCGRELAGPEFRRVERRNWQMDCSIDACAKDDGESGGGINIGSR